VGCEGSREVVQTSSVGINLIKVSESFEPHIYPCPANDATIGYGHLIHKGPPCGAASELPFANGIDETQGTALLLVDVQYAEHAVSTLVHVQMTQGMYDALVSFTYNLGTNALKTSTLLKLLNAGDVSEAAEQFADWVHSGGKVLPGLVTRRAAERALFVG
jgi:lysozyme